MAIPCESCPKPAREVILMRAGENMVGNGMAVWTALFRCGDEHLATADAMTITHRDPDAQVLVFSAGNPLVQDLYAVVQEP
jgi:hypothetical protein